MWGKRYHLKWDGYLVRNDCKGETEYLKGTMGMGLLTVVWVEMYLWPHGGLTVTDMEPNKRRCNIKCLNSNGC